jgi:hypothetical protein
MARLKKPGAALAAKVLSEVGFEHRLVGYRLSPRTGPMAVPMYSLKEVASLLAGPHPRMDLEALADWAKAALGDEDLAKAMRAALKKGKHNEDRTRRVHDLIALRLDQCRRLTGAPAEVS